MNKFQKRIKFFGDVRRLLEKVAITYKLGNYYTHKVISVGYEDYNLILTTSKGKYFVKIFAAYRTRAECERYVRVIRTALSHGVHHPKLLESPSGFLYQISMERSIIRLCVMEYIDGKSFYALRRDPNPAEARLLIKEAALINRIKLKPKFIYDSWAISNFLKEYKKKRRYLDDGSKKVIDGLTKAFSKLRLAALPHCLVHGDIIKTNVLRDKTGKLYIIDFSVSNYYPRIQELAVLLCSCLFDEKHPERIQSQRQFALTEYQKYIKLTEGEIKAYPIYCNVAHAMHVLQATYERKVKRNMTEENKYWLRLGRIGLGLAK